MIENICNFIPPRNDYHTIHTVNFVLETKKQTYSGLLSKSLYRVHLVCTGKGILHTIGKTIELNPGDLFFTFPGFSFAIESVEDFTYEYISFLGTRSNMIMEKLGISNSKFYFSDCTELCELWEKGLDTNREISDLITESILLYTFHFLGTKLLVSSVKNEPKVTLALTLKKYIDDNFSNQSLSLEYLAKELSYSPKYISTLFKKTFNIGLIEYLNTVRIQHACALINQGFTSVSDISNQCGYSDPQYFSKLFKKKLGSSPCQYMSSQRK